MTNITWHTARIGDTVWAVAKTQWHPAIVKALGRKRVKVQFETGATGSRAYGDVFVRRPCKNGEDRPCSKS